MPTRSHRVVSSNGIRVHLVEEGTGPAVLLVHGFPESWYSWRHQLPALASAGYRAIAMDVRGYGRSSAPTSVDAYRMTQHVADNVGLLDALGLAEAVIVGHDWGSPIAANTALLRPDRFPAVALLSVPYSPRGDVVPTAGFRAMGGEEEFYILYFQAPGRAEGEIEPDVRSWLYGFYVAASGQSLRAGDGGTITTVRPGGLLRDRFVYPDAMPGWLSEEDLDTYAAEFERTGFAGPLNRYRNVDRDWEDLAAWYRAPITQPSLFIGGELDGPTRWGQKAIDRYPSTMPGLRGSHILPGCGHWVQQERPKEVNEILLGFLASLDLG